jgi:protein-tyrosine-phosphatase
MNVIFVCTGNTCRSPMAEYILKHKLGRAGRHDIHVSSMGTHTFNGKGPSFNAIEACREHHIDITEHKSHQLIPKDLTDADIVFALEPSHIHYILDAAPTAQVELLAQWPDNDDAIVHDPCGGSLNEYRRTFKIIDKHITRILPYLLDAAEKEKSVK